VATPVESLKWMSNSESSDANDRLI